MNRLNVISQVGIVSLGFDCPEIVVDIDARPSSSLSDWLQRRGRAARAYPAIQGDRSYQTRALSGVRGVLARKQTPLLVSPCGSGKSHIAAMMAQSAAAKGKGLGFVTPRRILVFDLSSRFSAMGVPHGVIMAGRQDNGRRTKIVSVDTAISRDITLDVDCLVVDEAHLFASESRLALLDRHKHIPRVCLTATPHRTNGQGLHRIADELVIGPTPQELIDAGFLVPSRVFAPFVPDVSACDINGEDFNEVQVANVMMKPGITGNIVKEYLFRGQDAPCIVHACNVAHSKSIVERFNAAGVPAAHIDADSSDTEREEAFARLKMGARTKTHSILIDMAGNTLRFGFPEDDREWTLADTDAAPRAPHIAAMAVRRCEKCWYCFKASTDQCPDCGHAFVPTQRKIIERAAELVEAQRAKKAAAIQRLASTATDDWKIDRLAEYLRTAKERGYRPGWAIGRWGSIYGSPVPQETIRAAYARLKR